METSTNIDAGQCDSPLVVILPEETVQHCVTTCTHKRVWVQKEIIQCGHCWLWFHVECIKLEKKARQTYLSCPDCRQMPSLVRNIITEIVDVKHTFNKGLVTNNRLVSELKCKYAECRRIIHCETEYATYRTLITKNRGRRFEKKTQQKPELLVGSSITRDVKSTDSDQLHIITISDACTYVT